jgi:HAD superfamily hydrolase (TIGR01509 family)
MTDVIRPQWIVFDLGNVVVKLGSSLLPLVREQLGREVPQQFIDACRDHFITEHTNLSLKEQFQLGAQEPEEVYRKLSKLLDDQLSPERLRELDLQQIQGEFPQSLQLLEQLQRSHFRIACLSNTHAVHWEHMKRTYKSFRYFEKKLASHLYGVAKPNPEIYKKMFADLACEPKHILFIDDRELNIIGAQALGMQTIHLTDPATIEQQVRQYVDLGKE